MAPLPTPGGDNNVWGTILNTYLLVAHQADGTQNAADVVNVPTAPITSTDVQAAIDELASITATPGYFPVHSTAVDYTALVTDQVILVDSTAGVRTVTLPSPVVAGAGKVFAVRRINSAGSNARVDLGGAFTLDGMTLTSNRYLLSAQWEALTVVSDGANWQRLDQWSQAQFGGNPTNANQGHCWVSQTYGNDSNSGYQPWAAKKTIAAGIALNAIIVHVDRGTYDETVTMEQNGQLWGAGRGATIIRAPSVNADTIVCNTGNVIQDMDLQGFPVGSGGQGTGKILNAEAAGYLKARRLQIGNPSGYLPNVGHAGGPDPVYGGTAIYITEVEGAVFDEISIAQVRHGIEVDGATNGVAHVIFKDIYVNDSWKELLVYGVVGDISFVNMKTGSNNYGVSRDEGYIWELDIAGSTFINCTCSEGNLNSIRFHHGGDQGNSGYGNTFIDCGFAPESEVYIESDRNKFINVYTSNEINISGNGNEIDGFHATSATGVPLSIQGDQNSVKRFYRTVNANSQPLVKDYGNGTYIDGARRGGGPPGAGYGFRTGDLINNAFMAAGAPMGWICTVAALGSGDAQRGTWLEVSSGDPAALGGKAVQTAVVAQAVTGAVT